MRRNRRAVRVVLGVAAAAMIVFWVVLVLDDEAIGFGGLWAGFPSTLIAALAIAHVVTAPVAWGIAVVVLMGARRWVAGVLGLVAVPFATLTSLVAAMTDAWAWHTAAAQAAGLGSYLAAVAIVAAGPLSLLALIVVAIRTAR